MAVFAESPAYTLADGKPWNSTGPNGRTVTLTLFPDGNVKMNMGMISQHLTWQPTEDGLCLIGAPGGDQCMRLEQTNNGFVGFNGDEPSFIFAR
ncbi:MAG: hypothetical protein ACRC6I_12840 [Paracoccaceae bacterium]